MAVITLDRNRLKHNFNYLEKQFQEKHIEWAVVSKLLCGNKLFLKELLKIGVEQFCDSRISNLKYIKELQPKARTCYIKPPAADIIPDIVKYADCSLNTEERTIKLLSQEAKRQNKVHKVLIALELGELREGVMGEELITFYRHVFEMDNIEVIGLAANLSCLYGVLPTPDKLIQLVLYSQLLEATFNKSLKYISGGSSVSIPLLLNGSLPKGINHFRVGETLFFGTNVYTGELLEEMEHTVFQLYANLLEVSKKPMSPNGEFGTNLEGESFEVDESLLGKESIRGIIDVGILDVDVNQISFVDPNIKVSGVTSDMMVLDLGTNPKGYKSGDKIVISLNYMSTLRLMNSNYVDKMVIG
ncbi:alanine racemase [Porphyromonadaceae bacterium W3.11]|nr:alanine racemase [Porphyromonadaceae bacterium W3.11]